MVAELGGRKSLYSSSYYEEDEFWQHLQRIAVRAAEEGVRPATVGFWICTRSACEDVEEEQWPCRRSPAAFGRVLGDRPGLRLTAYDGSTFGSADAEVTLVDPFAGGRAVPRDRTGRPRDSRARSSAAPSWSRAVCTARSRCSSRSASHDVSMRDKLQALRELGAWVLKRPALPPEEASPPWRRGLRHSKERDAKAIAHHYDVSNRFYELVLGPSMTYTCAVYPDAGRVPGGGSGDQVRPGRPQARPRAGHAAARRRLRLGRHGHARRRALRRARRSASRSRDSRRSGRRRRSPNEGSPTVPRCASSTTATCPSRTSTRCRPSGSPSTSDAASSAPTSRGSPTSSVPRVGCSTTASPAPPPVSAPGPAASSTATCSPTASCSVSGRSSSSMQNHGFEPRHEENLREHYAMTLP